jgi:isoleucyl-tRNA synthetase
LRRSRRRFWKSESDGDKYAAYATLYEALVAISKLLAPTMPFIADAIHQNLVCTVDRNQPVSVHLAAWPDFDGSLIDEELNHEMALVMKLASVGHAARNRANRKVRQPLAEAAFSVGNVEESFVITKYADILEDELNVKTVRALNAAIEAVSYEIKPLPKQLGQKYGNQFPSIRKAILALDPEPAALLFLDNKPVPVDIDGTFIDILPEEVEVRSMAKEGFSVASEGSYMAALVTDLTPELEKEGLAREFVRRVQDLRKTADFDIADRIRLKYLATPKLSEAVKLFSNYIQGETLTLEMSEGQPGDDMVIVESDFDDEKVTIGVAKK